MENKGMSEQENNIPVYLKRILSVKGEEIEVTKEVMELYQNNFSLYKNEKYDLLEERPQMSTLGCCLKKNEENVKKESVKLCIAGDIITSVKFFRDLTKSQRTDEFEKLLLLFDYIHHTIGNCIPLPEGCNKGGNKGSDNFGYKLHKYKEIFENNDLQKGCEQWNQVKIRIQGGYSLGNIWKKKMDEINEKRDEKLISLSDMTVLKYWIQTEWLDEQKVWEDFINENYLQDFVGINNEPYYFIASNANIIRKEHSAKEIEESLRKAIELIVKRGYRITHDGKMNEEEVKKDLEELLKWLSLDGLKIL